MNSLKVNITKKEYVGTGRQKNFTAIEGLEFSAKPGEFLFLIGPSGCGKTTLLNIISGLDKAFSGQLELPDDVATKNDADKCYADKHCADIVYVFQEPRLLPWRTVLENISLAVPESAECQENILQLLDKVGLADFKDHYPGQLSLGMQRRVALVRAFALEPKVMLLDEPFVSLDLDSALKMRKLLLDLLHEHRATAIFVTHDLDEAIALADRILVLQKAPSRIQAELSIPVAREQRQQSSMELYKNQLLELMGGGAVGVGAETLKDVVD